MKTPSRRRWPRFKNRRGSVVLVGTGALFLLASFGLFVMDVGKIYRQKRIAQTAADAAALSGAWEKYRGWGLDSIQAHAQRASTTNGFTNGASSVTVTVLNPPTVAGSPYTGDGRFVEVLVSQTFPTSTMRFFGINSVAINARAIAGGGGTAISCLYVTEPTGIAVDMENADITTTCGMSINSTNTSALRFNKNNASITVTGGGQIAVTGSTDTGGKNPTISPAPTNGVPPAPNPFTTLSKPTPAGSCTYTNFKATNTQTVSPGTYCNGMELEKGTITFTSGTYILCGPIPGKGVNFYTKGGNVIIRDDGGDGVLLYFTKCVMGSTTYDYATPMNMEASSDIVLHAPKTGPYAGIAFYQDPGAPSNLPVSDWGASSTSNVYGAMYFPSTGINILTGGAVLRAAALVVDSIHASAQSLIDITNSYAGAPPPLKRVTLVE